MPSADERLVEMSSEKLRCAPCQHSKDDNVLSFYMPPGQAYLDGLASGLVIGYVFKKTEPAKV